MLKKWSKGNSAMKINKNQLMQIIKEEFESMAQEEPEMGPMPELDKLFQDAREIAHAIYSPDMDINEYGRMYDKLLTLLMKKRGLGEYEEEIDFPSLSASNVGTLT